MKTFLRILLSLVPTVIIFMYAINTPVTNATTGPFTFGILWIICFFLGYSVQPLGRFAQRLFGICVIGSLLFPVVLIVRILLAGQGTPEMRNFGIVIAGINAGIMGSIAAAVCLVIYLIIRFTRK